MRVNLCIRLLSYGVVTYSATLWAQIPNTFQDRQPALAEEINQNFLYLENSKGCNVDESGPSLKITCPDGKTWFAEKAPSLPTQTFTFNLLASPPQATSVQFGFKPSEPGYEAASEGLRDFGDGLVLKSIENTRFYNSNFIKSPEQGPLHVLCDPRVHIGYLPYEASVILYAGPNMLALRTKTAEESKHPSDNEASVGCLEPLPKQDPDNPDEPLQFQSVVHQNFTIVNTHGRFSCLTTDSDVETPVFNVVDIVNTPEANARAIDLFGVTVAYLENGIVRFASTRNTFDSTTNVIARNGPSITVPAVCP